jgi:hypothetical protein
MTLLWAQIAISVLTILASGVVSAWVTHFLNARKEKHEFMRSKLESLHEAVIQYDQLTSLCMAFWSEAMEGRLTYDDALKEVNAETEGKPDYYAIVETLSAFYFSTLEEGFQKCAVIASEEIGIVQQFRRNQVAGRDCLNPHIDLTIKFHEAGVALKAAIVAHGRERKFLPK